MSARIERLRAEVESDRAALDSHLDTLASLSLDAPSISPAVLAQAAWALHHAYTGIEAILERTARVIEGSLPEGPDWHKALLDDAALTIERTRPPLLSVQTVRALHDLRAFRHFVRHGSVVQLEASRLAVLQQRAADLRADLTDDLDRLDAWLLALSATLGQ